MPWVVLEGSIQRFTPFSHLSKQGVPKTHSYSYSHERCEIVDNAIKNRIEIFEFNTISLLNQVFSKIISLIFLHDEIIFGRFLFAGYNLKKHLMFKTLIFTINNQLSILISVPARSSVVRINFSRFFFQHRYRYFADFMHAG
jgi:hypothetical protein